MEFSGFLSGWRRTSLLLSNCPVTEKASVAGGAFTGILISEASPYCPATQQT